MAKLDRKDEARELLTTLEELDSKAALNADSVQEARKLLDTK